MCKTEQSPALDTLYAHSYPERPLEGWQPLDIHLKAVAETAARFAEAFHSAPFAYNAGLLHDIGKAAPEFQGYLRRCNAIDDPEYAMERGRINHSSTGAALAEEAHTAPLGRILAYLIAGHHAGLPDYNTSDGGNGALPVRLGEGQMLLDSIRTVASGLYKGHQCLSSLPPGIKTHNFHLWVRMLFSCLTDADFLDTEAFMTPANTRIRECTVTLADMKTALDRHLGQLAVSTADSPVNKARRAVLAACRAAAQKAPGLFTLTVPTGGGKTLASMAFALDHALAHGKARIIYVIPYTSIIEQTADIFRKVLGQDAVIEHHSNIEPQNDTPRSRLASENWDAPLVITTNVQFFESLYAARSSRCRKLHNLVNSVVILDEAQLVPSKLLEPCVDALRNLITGYGVTIVLSTATQPALTGLPDPTEIIGKDLDLYKTLKRTRFHLPTRDAVPVTWEEMAEKLLRYEQVLCIVNTRRDCRDLHALMPPGTIHLSALMCGQHRSEVIASIKQKLKAEQPVRVISTQLVEAGVDIDFPVVYRALAGFDSIAQAAGRCNREGNLPQGEVYVFHPPKPSAPGLLRKGEELANELMAISACDLHDPASFRRYFELYYNRVNDKGEAILYELTRFDTTGPDALALPFRTIGDRFRLIDDTQSPVFVRYGDSDALIAELKRVGPHRQLMRKLQRYTVNVPRRVASRLADSGLIERIWQDQFLVQAAPSLYHDLTGLDIDRQAFTPDELIG